MATFVLVHGAGHGSWCWDRLAPLLHAEGHRVFTPTLVGVGDRFAELTPQIGLASHVEQVAALIDEEDLHDILLVGHSYGCMVITGVAGRIPDRISELVFLDGPHPHDGECLADASPGMRAVLEPSVRIVDGVELCLFPDATTLQVYGFSQPEDVEWAAQHLTPHPWKCFLEPLRLKDEAGMNAIPRTSVDCLDSEARRDPVMLARSRAADRRVLIDTGHDLMISAPHDTAEILLKLAREPFDARARPTARTQQR